MSWLVWVQRGRGRGGRGSGAGILQRGRGQGQAPISSTQPGQAQPAAPPAASALPPGVPEATTSALPPSASPVQAAPELKVRVNPQAQSLMQEDSPSIVPRSLAWSAQYLPHIIQLSDASCQLESDGGWKPVIASHFKIDSRCHQSWWLDAY